MFNVPQERRREHERLAMEFLASQRELKPTTIEPMVQINLAGQPYLARQPLRSTA